ncbi:MAG: efflux RND transporter permease subunit [Chromatiales bacterium]|nr:efflux RND transporter permease subunit [Chromatiales bacterium]
MGLVRFSVDNPLVVNLVLALVLLGGVLSWRAMPQEMFPVIETDKVQVTTLFEGASPVEVERQITVAIEQELDGLSDIDEITSTSDEGVSRIVVKLKPGADVDDFLRETEAAIDQIQDLPEEAEEPVIKRLKTRFPVISIALYGNAEAGRLRDIAERLRRKVEAMDGIGSVGIAGDREWELWVTVDPGELAARGIALETIETALRSNLRDLPGGSIAGAEGDVLLRGVGVPPDPESVGAIALRTNATGGVLRLREIAKVDVRLEEPRTLGRFNGERSINLVINKTATASTIAIAEAVHELVREFDGTLPPGIHASSFNDLSVYVRTRLETVKSSGLIGLGLLLGSLYLLLNGRVALITALGIPVSFLFAVMVIHYAGYTINMVSLFAFLIALGLIVDDAIIVTENVYRHLEEGAPPREAALAGAREVFWPVIAATSTTIAAFLPMFAVTGTMGAFISVIPAVVSAALVGSLFEAFAVLPSHAHDWLRVAKTRTRKRLIDWSAALRRYTGLLRWTLVNRYITAAFAIGTLVLAVAFAATRVPFNLFGSVDVGQFFVNVEAPNTYSLEDSEALAKRLEAVVYDVVEPHELKSLLTNVGVEFVDFQRFRLGSQYIQLIIDLTREKPRGFIERYVNPLVSLRFDAPGERERRSEDVINVVRESLSRVPGVTRLAILRPQGGPAGADVEIGIIGDRIDNLRAAAVEIRDWLVRIPGVHDVRHDADPGKLEYRYRLNAAGRELGLTQEQLARVVRTGFVGREVTHVNWRNERIPVRVIYPESLREDSAALANLRLTTGDGRTVYLHEIADFEVERSPATVQHRNLRRLVAVTADVDDKVTTPNDVIEQFQREFADFAQTHPGYTLVFLGEKKEANESFASLSGALIMALAVIFFILAWLFRSLLDPLVVMAAIPFGFIGVVVGHVIFGFNLQFLSGIGFLALTGIVVNDSLILVDFAKKRRAEGYERIEAVVEAGRVRIRPILLTSITTFLSVSPLIFFASGQTAFLSPMAVSLGFGLLFSTVLILVAVPSFYLIADDLRTRAFRMFGREDLEQEIIAPHCSIDERPASV